MNCANHPDKEASGACVYCGKLFCPECLINVKGRMYCKDDIGKIMEEEKSKARNSQSHAKKLYMNGGAKSSSSAASGQLIPTKNKVLAAILAFLLGSLGIHKFYLGQSSMGIIYLLFCWTGIPLLISLVEGIVYLVSSDHMFARKYGGQVM